MEHVLRVKANEHEQLVHNLASIAGRNGHEIPGRPMVDLVRNLMSIADLIGAELNVEEMLEIRTQSDSLRNLILQVQGITVWDLTAEDEARRQADAEFEDRVRAEINRLKGVVPIQAIPAEETMFFQSDHGEPLADPEPDVLLAMGLASVQVGETPEPAHSMDPEKKHRGRKPSGAPKSTKQPKVLPLCEICHERPVKSSRSKICDSDECEKKRAQDYVNKSRQKLAGKGADQHPFVGPGAGAALDISDVPWPADGSTWRVITGTERGKYLAMWELPEWLQDSPVESGAILEHRTKGMHIVTGLRGSFKVKLMSLPPSFSQPLPEGQPEATPPVPGPEPLEA